MTTERYGVPAAKTSARVARTLLALHVAGERGILMPDLIDRVQASRATLYRVLAVIRAAGWRIDSEREQGYARVKLAAWQRLPRHVARVPEQHPGRRKPATGPTPDR